MTLHKIEEVKVYCGPAALMAVTGKRLPEVRAVVNEIRGRVPNKGIMGMKNVEMEKALRVLGVAFRYHEDKPKRQLRHLIPDLDSDVRYVINVTGHYVSYYNGVIIDNHYRFGTTIDECRWAGKRVKVYWRIK